MMALTIILFYLYNNIIIWFIIFPSVLVFSFVSTHYFLRRRLGQFFSSNEHKKIARLCRDLVNRYLLALTQWRRRGTCGLRQDTAYDVVLSSRISIAVEWRRLWETHWRVYIISSPSLRRFIIIITVHSRAGWSKSRFCFSSRSTSGLYV